MLQPISAQRVLLVDDHQVFRDSLKAVIDSHPQLSVVADASGVDEAMKKLEAYEPSMVVTDLHLAHGTGHDLIKRVREHNPEILIVVVSVNTRSSEKLKAKASGANGYITKGSHRQEILQALTEMLSPSESTH